MNRRNILKALFFSPIAAAIGIPQKKSPLMIQFGGYRLYRRRGTEFRRAMAAQGSMTRNESRSMENSP